LLLCPWFDSRRGGVNATPLSSVVKSLSLSIAMKNPGRVACRGQEAAGAFIVGTATR